MSDETNNERSLQLKAAASARELARLLRQKAQKAARATTRDEMQAEAARWDERAAEHERGAT